MAISLKKLFNENKVGTIIILLVIAYGVFLFANYLGARGMPGPESASDMPNQYKGEQGPSTNAQFSSAVKPSEPLGHNEVFASANGIQSSNPNAPVPCANTNINNPAELLPKDVNSQWASLNPSGKGELANVNLLKAGYHIGIDTVGQSLRNANLQIRSEPPNPQLNVGPWMNSTITPDFLRPPLEIGQGTQ